MPGLLSPYLRGKYNKTKNSLILGPYNFTISDILEGSAGLDIHENDKRLPFSDKTLPLEKNMLLTPHTHTHPSNIFK